MPIYHFKPSFRASNLAEISYKDKFTYQSRAKKTLNMSNQMEKEKRIVEEDEIEKAWVLIFNDFVA